MRMRAPHWLVLGAVALTALGGWLWLRLGVPVWLQDAMAFCF